MTKITRYLTREKFSWLLSDRGLYVGAAKDQIDTTEGCYDHIEVFKPLRGTIQPHVVDFNELDALALNFMHNDRAHSYISSWYLGDEEQERMWNEYAPDGVLIVSSASKLTSLLPDPLTHTTSFYKVIYDDHKKLHSATEALKYKNQKYRYENEFRLVFNAREYSLLTGYEESKFPQVFSGNVRSFEDPTIISSISKEGLSQKLQVIYPKGAGHILKIDLSKLIDEIRVHPGCLPQDEHYLRTSLHNAGFDFKINRSQLVVPGNSR